jgi:ribosomal protein RSM22 (predicted rRNA methylase)
VTPILPATLRESLDQIIQGFASAELARRSDVISEIYRSGAGSARAIADDADVAAYLAARLPATYAAMAAVLARVKEHAPAFAPGSLLDAGAGPGTASWAAASLWPSVAAVTMLDRNPRLLALARKLCAGSGIEALHQAQTIAGDMTALESKEFYDAVLAGYAVAEIPSASFERALDALWKACRGVLVIVEPGTQAGFARIREARDLLLARGARMIAPCPGSYACPIASPDWCHFSVRLPRSRAHMRAKGASVPFEDEKFSYLAVARDTVAIALPKGRIVAEPHAAKPGVTLRVCSDGAIAERMAPRRDKPAYKRAAKAEWGDAYEP